MSKILLILIILLPGILIQLAAQSTYFAPLIVFVQSHIPLYVAVLIVLKSLSLIYPPLPGVILTLGSIPLIGWELAYFSDIVGNIIGGSISYYLGIKYGKRVLHKFFGAMITNKIVSIKLKDKNQFEAALFLRFASGGLLSDAIAWGAGIIGFRYLPFIAGFTVSHIAITLPIFYMISLSISVHSWIIFGIAAAAAWFILYKFKGRYFE